LDKGELLGLFVVVADKVIFLDRNQMMSADSVEMF